MSKELLDVFSGRAGAPTPQARRSLLGASSCSNCKEMATKLEASHNRELQLNNRELQWKNKLFESKKELELARKKHSEINNDIIRGNVRLQTRYPSFPHPLSYVSPASLATFRNLLTMHELQAKLKAMTVERDDLLRQTVRQKKENISLKAENKTLKTQQSDILEMLDRRLTSGPSLSHLDLKARRFGTASSPLFQELQTRGALFSPGAFPVTNADLAEPLKGGNSVARKSFLARPQQALSGRAEQDEKAEPHQEKPAQQTLPPIAQQETESDSDISDDSGGSDDQDRIHRWLTGWNPYFDGEEQDEAPMPLTTTTATPKRKRTPLSAARSELRTPKRPKRERAKPCSSSESEDSSSSRPSRSAKARITNLREPKLGRKLRAGYPGTFDLDGAVPLWQERETNSIPKPKALSQASRVRAHLEARKTLLMSRGSNGPASAPPERTTSWQTPLKPVRKRDASDIEVEEDGFRYFTKATSSTPAKRLASRQPTMWTSPDFPRA